jgi:hypothetical protein
MTITFENDSDVIVYALEKIIPFARENQFLFVANCVWWISEIIGLELGLVAHINNLEERKSLVPLGNRYEVVQPSKDKRPSTEQEVSSIPMGHMEDQHLDRIIVSHERIIQESVKKRFIGNKGRVNPQPSTRKQRKKANKLKQLQVRKTKQEADHNISLRKLRPTIIRTLNKE